MSKFLSVCIPAYNCRDTIERLLDSIVIQGWSKDDLEVVICDDNSTDNFMELVEPYNSDLSITYIKTKEREVHCPGNTRHDALEVVDSEWVTFIDNDDLFTEDIFTKVKSHIDTTNESACVCCDFISVDNDTLEPISEYVSADTWLHGKYFNVKYLREHNVQFKENLASSEDTYFTGLLLGYIISDGKDYSYLHEYAYKWVNNPKSLSRSFYSEKYYYTDVYFEDYLDSIIEPNSMHLNKFPIYSSFYVNQIMMGIAYSYFYYESLIWRLGGNDEMAIKNLGIIRDKINTLQKEFKFSREYIVNYLYSLPDRYIRLKDKAISSCGLFLELDSFKDFILNL